MELGVKGTLRVNQSAVLPFCSLRCLKEAIKCEAYIMTMDNKICAERDAQ